MAFADMFVLSCIQSGNRIWSVGELQFVIPLMFLAGTASAAGRWISYVFIRPVKNTGYVLAGFEKEYMLAWKIAAGWGVTLCGSFILQVMLMGWLSFPRH